MDTRKTYTYDEMVMLFDEALDAQGPITIAGVDYNASLLLHCADKLHYDLAFDAWLDSNGFFETESGDGYYNDNN